MPKISDEKRRSIELVVHEIVALTGDESPRSVSYFVAGSLRLGEHVVRRLIGVTKETAPRDAARYFSTLMRRELEKLAGTQA